MKTYTRYFNRSVFPVFEYFREYWENAFSKELQKAIIITDYKNETTIAKLRIASKYINKFGKISDAKQSNYKFITFYINEDINNEDED